MMTSEARFPLRVGTRGSPLAVRQTEWVVERLRAVDRGLEVEIHRIKTSGDRITGRPLAEIGGKGLFIKEIEEALLAGTVDVAVHSMKDLPATLPEGLTIAAVPPREDPRDALVASTRGGLEGLRPGSRVGTGSLRRKALVRSLRPDLEVVPLRGNVETRIAKWRKGEVDALILALAGIHRLGLALPEAEVLPPETFIPAIGQGALALEASPANGHWQRVCALDEPAAAAAVRAERAFLVALGGDCTTPVAAHARVEGSRLVLVAMIARPDGAKLVRGARSGPVARPEPIGRLLAEELLGRGGREMLQERTP
jgi:hydroxymethylbilane synthase